MGIMTSFEKIQIELISKEITMINIQNWLSIFSILVSSALAVILIIVTNRYTIQTEKYSLITVFDALVKQLKEYKRVIQIEKKNHYLNNLNLNELLNISVVDKIINEINSFNSIKETSYIDACNDLIEVYSEFSNKYNIAFKKETIKTLMVDGFVQEIEFYKREDIFRWNIIIEKLKQMGVLFVEKNSISTEYTNMQQYGAQKDEKIRIEEKMFSNIKEIDNLRNEIKTDMRQILFGKD